MNHVNLNDLNDNEKKLLVNIDPTPLQIEKLVLYKEKHKKIRQDKNWR